MSSRDAHFEVVVKDAVPAAPASVTSVNGNLDTSAIPAGFGLAVISGLADDVLISASGAGVTVRMTWPLAVKAEA
jgi:hypothetical protein